MLSDDDGDDDNGAEEFTRLGKYETNKDRPMKVILQSNNMVEFIFRNVKIKQSNKWKRVHEQICSKYYECKKKKFVHKHRRQ